MSDRPTRAQPAELAWPKGDTPESCGFTVPVQADIVQELVACIPLDVIGRIEREQVSAHALAPPGPGLQGRYHLSTPSRSLFVRVTARLGHPKDEEAIVQYLAAAGVPVDGIEACGLSRETGNGQPMRIDVRPFLSAAHHFRGQPEELEALGRSLRQLHRALRAYPGAEAIKRRSQSRFAALSDRAEKLQTALSESPDQLAKELAPYANWIEANRNWLARTAASIDVCSLTNCADAQCVHGEPHPANVVFEDGKAVLVDFEEAVHLFVSPLWDIAFAVQRFVMADNPAPENRRARLTALAVGYGREIIDTHAMRCVAWATLMIIFDTWIQDGIAAPVSECEKFRYLEEQARSVDFNADP